jgi:Coenzyme PQQ synthesis protein D (PqqD)
MIEVSLSSRVKISEDVLFQELQGDAVLLDLKTGVYFGLDKVGARMWNLFGDDQSLDAVAARIVIEYDVSPERCSADLIDLVSKLQEQGLIIIE